MSQRILIPLPSVGYECTEAAVPYKALTDAGHEVVFATPDGQVATVDMGTSTGEGLGWAGYLFRAAKPSLAAYQQMVDSAAYAAPVAYADIDVDRFDAVVIPGGHHHEMTSMLASEVLQGRVAAFSAQGKLVSAICHGVVLAARSLDASGRSILAGHKVTTVPGKTENQCQGMCAKRMGHERYGKPSELTAEDEIRQLMGGEGELVIVKMPLLKDAPGKEHRGVCFIDGHIVTARMPHDSWCFAKTVVEQLAERAAQGDVAAVA